MVSFQAQISQKKTPTTIKQCEEKQLATTTLVALSLETTTKQNKNRKKVESLSGESSYMQA